MPSPLGLIDVNSTISSNLSGLASSHTIKGGQYQSLVTRGSKFYYRPLGDANQAANSQFNKIYGTINDNSTNDINNISTASIIDYCQQDKYPGMYLTSADFAYLRELGVYPNNRLVICRRFTSPVSNDLTISNMKPVSTLISWYKEFPVKISVGEKWEPVKGNFLETLEEMFNMKGFITGGSSAIADVTKNAVPLPGFSSGLQFALLKELGFTDLDYNNLPEGNPNLINQSQMRTHGGGDGLTSKVSIDFETLYEQKFINNIDPEIMFLDLIGNALRFGTSKSEFFITGKASGKIRDFFNKFRSGDWVGAITIILDAVITAVKSFAQTIGNTITQVVSGESGDPLEALKKAGQFIAAPVMSKFKIKMGAVISAMAGEPSTPWHVTVGNPKKPTFSSGDMLCTNVNIELGDTLSFNDLPSTIKVTFTLEGARTYGLQEIFDKFNNGAGRSYSALPTNYDTQISGVDTTNGVVNNSGNGNTQNTNSNVDNTISANSTVNNGRSNTSPTTTTSVNKPVNTSNLGSTPTTNQILGPDNIKSVPTFISGK